MLTINKAPIFNLMSWYFTKNLFRCSIFFSCKVQLWGCLVPHWRLNSKKGALSVLHISVNNHHLQYQLKIRMNKKAYSFFVQLIWKKHEHENQPFCFYGDKSNATDWSTNCWDMSLTQVIMNNYKRLKLWYSTVIINR